ncbi:MULTISPECIES: hypothetical protein [Bacillales]|jgi:hypothetical protein|uniref:Uncharacterized protein n=4 Tax=Bacillales TaxID=1385 RepID=A0A160MD48_9BACI|nr:MULTISPECIES: hypothetical protein [Bacillales]EFV77031.1 hypothetical protein HMPREF1013_02756 [Bacillus sp. 2_A_57_CT2]MDM5224642.1 hypothetical protein [Cytobacillus sp. NJ13]AND40969.1 hypothetical protein A361_18045 [Cytobacillus oceanisediminis 2691]KON87648.1 hypothetical protein AF332_12950 [Sporosarcina globispora]MBU8733022.1 hypothetical protein [Cytobacillus oceanisediminis]
MKRSYLGVIILAAILMMNIVFTQYMVHQYYYENYVNVLIFGGLNIVLFPLAVFAYKKTINMRA